MQERKPIQKNSHSWKIRSKGYRELLKSKGWSFRGGFAEKSISGRSVIMKILQEEPGYLLCSLIFKDVFISLACRQHIEEKHIKQSIINEVVNLPCSLDEEEITMSVDYGYDIHKIYLPAAALELIRSSPHFS